MKKKILFLGLALLMAGQLMIAQSYQMVTLSANGTEATYPVSDVQQVVFASNSMTVKMKEGADASSITCIKFTESTATGIIDQKSESAISVFPNPVTDMLSVSGVKKDAIIYLYNMNGALLQTVTSQENATNINVSSLQQGIYLLRINNLIIKFIKK